MSTSAELGPRGCPDDSPQQTSFQPRNRDEARLSSQTRQGEPQPDSQDTYTDMAESKNWILVWDSVSVTHPTCGDSLHLAHPSCPSHRILQAAEHPFPLRPWPPICITCRLSHQTPIFVCLASHTCRLLTTTVTDILGHPASLGHGSTSRHPSTSSVSFPHLNIICHISNSDHIHGVVSRALPV